MLVRASLGTLGVLGTRAVSTDAECTTAYFLLGTGCRGACSFCAQSRLADRKGQRLSRITWPDFDIGSLNDRSEELKRLSRVCFQCMNYSLVVSDLLEMLGALRVELTYEGSISASLNPIGTGEMKLLRKAGLSDICFPYDLPTGKLFKTVKLGTRVIKTCNPEGGENDSKDIKTEDGFQNVSDALDNALRIFGKGHVATHLMVGMGETDRELAERMLLCREQGINVALFALTPLKGTLYEGMAPPPLARYRAVQLMSYLIIRRGCPRRAFVFDDTGVLTGLQYDMMPECEAREMAERRLFGGDCFRTAGCEHCNRPCYNERPGQVPYNYPMELTANDVADAAVLLDEYIQWGF